MKTALQPLKNSLFNKKRKIKPDITKTMTKFTVSKLGRQSGSTWSDARVVEEADLESQ